MEGEEEGRWGHRLLQNIRSKRITLLALALIVARPYRWASVLRKRPHEYTAMVPKTGCCVGRNHRDTEIAVTGYLACPVGDKRLFDRIWDTASGQCLKTLIGTPPRLPPYFNLTRLQGAVSEVRARASAGELGRDTVASVVSLLCERGHPSDARPSPDRGITPCLSRCLPPPEAWAATSARREVSSCPDGRARAVPAAAPPLGGKPRPERLTASSSERSGAGTGGVVGSGVPFRF
ncbi:hypothetical protein J1605_019613 [Eschrichtius robustus]|uniref:Uncharacterized protein n=1 Tax=Eschrichtius robustus TaxID=9764 RepID=A0AB34HPB2_ESCRO|nr:hypothetical protein J1605_019613 [Eschrichtius robustus]